MRTSILLLALILGIGAVAPATASAGTLPPAWPSWCGGTWDYRQRADEVLVNRWRLPPHPAVTLPANRTWVENPLNDRNWQYQDHSLGLVLALFRSWADSGDARYRDRATAILRDWIVDNPRWTARSPFAWNDHATANRGVVLACTTVYLGRPSWLNSALVLHGQTLASADFYTGAGNHALNQDIGLLEVANVLGRSDWKSLAVSRISRLAAASIDSQGVTNEQSVGYQGYNYRRYELARTRIIAMGLAVPSSLQRVTLMPGFMAHATLPNGEYEMLGDTDRVKAPGIPGTWTDWMASAGTRGRPPGDSVAVYRAGYLFARTGWGVTRPFDDEVFTSLRWGVGRRFHGHDDHGSVTLYGFGSRLLVDPGKYTYDGDAWRAYFVGRRAHNIVTVDGLTWNSGATSSLLGSSRTATAISAKVRLSGYAGVAHTRGIVFSRRMGYVLVDDQLSSSSSRVYRQLWHLTEDARPSVLPAEFVTRRAEGNVRVRQLITGGVTSSVVAGRTSPIQGWVAWEFGKRVAAPVVDFRRAGSNVRFLTLLMPAAGDPGCRISDLRLTSTGYSVVVSSAGRAERVVVSGTSATITPLN